MWFMKRLKTLDYLNFLKVKDQFLTLFEIWASPTPAAPLLTAYICKSVKIQYYVQNLNYYNYFFNLIL